MPRFSNLDAVIQQCGCRDSAIWMPRLIIFDHDEWGAHRAYSVNHGILIDNLVDDQVASKSRNMGNCHGQEKLPMGEGV